MSYKIAIAGPSGTGKTTIAENIIDELGLKHITSAQTRVVPKEVSTMWQDVFGYSGDIGHQKLINLQNAQPYFGKSWQWEMLLARGKVIRENNNFIMDRSPIDSLTYMLNQVGHNVDKNYVSKFVDEVRQQLKELTHVIFIPYNNPDWVEENGSRISQVHFQKLMSSSFEHVIDEYLIKIKQNVWGKNPAKVVESTDGMPNLLVLDTWDLLNRLEQVHGFLCNF